MISTSVLPLLALSSLGLAHPAWYKESWKEHIKNVVVLVEENRSFDTFAGGFSYDPSIDGLLHRSYCQPSNVSYPQNSQTICAQPIAQDVAPDDPNHSISGVNMQLFSTYHPSPTSSETMQGFLSEQGYTYNSTNITRNAEAINYYTQDEVRVFASMAENFVLFDRWFAAVPGPTNPNRAYLTSGTSYDHGRNDEAFLTYGMPQRSIFQQLSENGISWINYSNTTNFLPDAEFYTWTGSTGKNLTNVKPLSQFYTDAEAGTLPQFTYLNPECCLYYSFHPPSPITLGESFIKGVYEALRASPQWESTLFILTFDEHGGFADHVPPPENVPAGDSLTYTEKAPDGKNITFDFTRLGIRVPTLVISPWVGKGVVEHKGSNQGGEYSHTSLLAFLAKLWDLDYLTPRVAWSATWEHLISDYFRDDTPSTLPSAFPF
jgi:phospholipase C